MTQSGDPRLTIRVKDHSSDVIDIVAWRECTDESLWTEHSKVFFLVRPTKKDSALS